MSPRVPFLVLLTAVIAVGARTAWQDRTAEEPTEREAASTPADPALEEDTAAEADDSQRGSGPSTWYCAAGTAGGLADHLVVLSNPTDRSVGANLTVFFDDNLSPSASPASKPYRIAVPARQELRIGLADFERALPSWPPNPARPPTEEPSSASEGSAVGPDALDETFVAALVEVDQTRAQLDAGEQVIRVEHEVSGPHGETSGPCARQGAPEWHFAWGRTTRDARDVLVVFNPFPSDAVVDAEFSTPDGRREPVRWQGLTVPGGTIVAVEVGADITRQQQVAATVRARAGNIVVERLQTFDGSLDMPEGMRLVLGRPRPVQAASFPGGSDTAGGSELIALYNPTEEAAEVTVVVRPEDGAGPAPLPFDLVVQPERFEMLDYAREARVASGTRYRTLVRSTNRVPIVPEQVLVGSTDASKQAPES